MKILFVSASTDFSIGDVSRGYRMALERAGHDVADYMMPSRFNYHMKAIPREMHHDQNLVSKMASETILNEALYHRAELVIIVSGLNVHPISMWLLGRVNIPVAVILTESPYDDVEQKQWLDMNNEAETRVITFTNDRYSAMKYGWNFCPPSFDPQFHKPTEPNPETTCDVIMVGTGWQERQAFLEAVDWSGIDFKIFGVWPGISDNSDSPLNAYYKPGIIDNSKIAGVYASAKICLNFHRNSDVAMTPGPRVFELAACGAFQLSDSRADLVAMFGNSIPTFRTPGELQSLVKYYLQHDELRKAFAELARTRVESETFDVRLAQVMDVVTAQLSSV